ncbi:MAG: hypothetical protein P0S95_07685 [Rhabdochlamydiaceae bacterium]|nr:hypothetical protein [Candidatus Amphrikana amoebophyrae]
MTVNSNIEEEMSTKQLLEFTQKGLLFPEIQILWEDLFGYPIEDAVNSAEFKKRGVLELIGRAKRKAQSNPNRKKLLQYLEFLKSHNDTIFRLLSPNNSISEKIRHAGHFVDQKLKYEYPKSGKPQQLETIKSTSINSHLNQHAFEVKTIGVRLSPAQDKLINSLQKLLHQKSQNNFPDQNDYYTGNMENGLVPFGNEPKKSPRIAIKPGELYRAYTNKSHYSADEMQFVRETLKTLADKKFLLVFDRKRKVMINGKMQTRTDRIEEYQSLIKVIKYTEDISDGELEKMNSGNGDVFESKGELIIGFNPILVDQINSKYIEYPSDIHKKMSTAAGGTRRVTEAMNILRDYMLRELSSKRTTVALNKEKMIYLLKLDKLLETRQKKRAQKKVDKAIDTIIQLGLIQSYEMKGGAKEQEKYIFYLNPNFK